MKLLSNRFEEVKKETKKYFDSIDKVYCPYLKTDVHFNREGFEHLLTKTWNRGRSIEDQYIRLRLLPKVVSIIKLSQTLQEYDERNMLVRQKTNSKWKKKMKRVCYYVFVCILIEHNIRFKIVIKQIVGSNPVFWSVYPSWKIFKDTNGNVIKKFYSGNLEND